MAACIAAPKPAAPQLPQPFGIPGIAVGQLSFAFNICCKLPPVSTPPLPPFLDPKSIPSGVVAAINAGIKAVLDYIDLLAFDCPREL